MEQQSLRKCWSNGKGAINAWCSIPSAVTAEMMSMNDFHDWIYSNVLRAIFHYYNAVPPLHLWHYLIFEF